MKKLYLRSLVAVVIGNNDRIKAILVFFLTFFFCCLSYAGYSQVVISSASGGTSICSNRAVGGSAAGFTTLGNITITEGLPSDFAGPGTDVIVLNTPAGWQFNTAALPTFGYSSGANVTSVTPGPFTSSSLTVYIATNGTTAGDGITITGLGVQATSAGAATGNIYASSVTGVAGVTSGTSGSNFGTLSLNPLTTPAVTITASPGSSICAGTDAVFTILTSSGGGGAPSYQWSLNGSTVATGITYANSTLVSGNYITCTMTSSAACITTSTAISNTIIMTVNPVPSAITGATGVCPAATINLSDPTPSGNWSTGNTTIATVGPSGIVTGITAGNALITYTAGTCAATTTVTVNNIPITPVLTPSTASVCNGSSITIIASGISTPPTVISQNFNSGLSPWTVDNTGSVGTIPASAWNHYPDGTSLSGIGTFHSPDNSGFAMSNADASGSTTITSSRLVSPVFSLVGYASATLTFEHSYEAWHADSTVELDISTNGGTTWTTLYNWLGTTVGTQTDFITETFPLTAYLGMSNIQIRFFYNSNWGYYWAIDNVLITGTSSGVVPTWSPVTYLFSDPGLTTPYTSGTAANTVYMYPTTVTSTTVISYTATASNLGCTSVGTNTITVNPAPGTIAGNNNICAGLTSALSDAVTGGTWTSSNTAVATVVPGTGIVTGVSVGSAVITYTLSGGCYTTVAVTVNPLPSAIGGTLNVCSGSSTNLNATPGGGTWSSGNLSIATVVSGSGYVTGASPGTAVITYSLGAGCVSTASVVVNQVPSAIAGQTSVCTGSTINLSDGVSGGTWSCSNTSFATITPGTGILTGVTAGIVTVTYTLPGNCTALLSVTVYSLPTTISGNMSICQGSSTTLSDSPSGGIWSSSNTTIATIVPGTSIVAAASTGTANITYTIGSSCIATASVTVNPLPSVVSGVGTVCAGSVISLSDATPGGTWSSSNTSIATVDPIAGTVSGVSGGPVTITYTLGTGCTAVKSVTVNPLPAPVTGINAVCIGLTTNLSDMSGGGTWSSSNTSAATIVPGSGLVYAVSSGISNMTYTLPTGCNVIQGVTVNSLPSVIYGTTNVCVGLTTTLSNAVSGGTWSSSNTLYAAAGNTTGIITGISAGIVNITYTLGTSCIATTTLQVNPLSPITGITNVCQGLTTNLSDATGGGTWSSSNTSVATISGTGTVTGITANTIAINYILPTGCTATTSVIVNPIPAAIAGNTNVCLSSTSTLSDGGGGTWSSSNTSVATIGLSNGIVLGLSTGTSPITYSLSAGCTATTTVTVNPPPATITGVSNVCAGSSITLSDATLGGTWSSGNTAYATAGAGGVVTGVSAGPVSITYTLPTGCTSVKNITVNPLPSVISGVTNVCAGLTTTLSDATTSGTWSSSNTAIATITGSGIVSGAAAGTAVIAYGIGTGCAITTSVVVDPLPAAITGMPNVCVGLGTVLSDVTGGGTWSSGNTSVATITLSGSGIVSGISTGTAVITYTLGTGCFTTSIVTVNPLPNAITGTTTLCAGTSTGLSDAGGGTWSSSNSSLATIVSATGVMTGASAGNANITYTLSTGCIATTSVLINPLPSAISGILNVCSGFITTLSDITAGGAWSSSNTSVATITVSGSGVVSSVSPGTTVITYMLGTGCLATKTVTVNPLPNTITGTTTVCAGSTTVLSDAGGGTWSSSNTTIATVVSATGVVTGVSGGNTNITYTLPTGCITTTTISVNQLPAAITGSLNVCYSSTTNLSDATAGGAWSSSNTFVAVIDPVAGVVTTESPGTTTITYTLGTGCITTKTVTVNPLPSGIVGQATLCIGSNATLSDATAGGTWSSSNSSLATIVSTTGVVTGASAGSPNITYTLSTGCIATKNITVNPQPPAISGITGICLGSTTNLSDASAGGTWASGNTTVAIINTATGLVSATAAGTSLITYVVDTGCAATVSVTVHSLPSAISGASSICTGQTTPLSDAGGGTWSSNNTSYATVGSSNGIVTGVGPGAVSIIYTLSTGCSATKNITVNAMPSAISGITGICLGGTTTLSDAVAGGTWSSSNTNVAVIDVNTGVVAGGFPGTCTITYMMPGNCDATILLTVNSLPSGISGASTLCVGLSTSLTDGTAGGLWSSSNTSVATVSSTGHVTGLSAGGVTIYYSLATGCAANSNITVYSSPASITGTTSICLGSGTVLSDAVSGGTWSSSNIAYATIDPVTGIVTSISPGATVITYAMPGGCSATVPVIIYPLPSAIIGSANVCVGLTTALTDGTAGGLWSSSNTSIATVNSTGIVTGLTAGSVTIYYLLATGCSANSNITVYSSPASITGTTSICLGSGTILSDAVSGGTWSSSNTAYATIDPVTGIVSSISPGTTVITYSMPGGCSATIPVIIHPSPSGIIGSVTTCVGLTTTLSDLVSGGQWSSSNTSVATVTSGTGIVSGVAPGVVVITYLLAGTCETTTSVTVNALPSLITGITNICLGSTTILSDAVTGGTWSSNNTSVASIGVSTGVVAGLSAGSATITYSILSGCSVVTPVTVDPAPSGITGTTVTCVGLTTTLSDGVAGGTWSSSNTAIATVTTGTGIVKGVTAGTVNITYSLAGGCITTTSVTIESLPSTIIGSANLCLGSVTNLSDAVGGGTWSSSNTSVAMVGVGTGLVTGLSPGTSTVTYSIVSGCATTTVVTVSTLPGAITGTTTVCIGLTTHLSDGSAGGTWSSGNTSIATVVVGTGVVTGVTSGTSNIIYTLPTGCTANRNVTVSPLPTGISGITNVCLGYTSTLSDGTAGGTWTSSNTTVATVDPVTGIVSGVIPGTSTITYSLGAGCSATVLITVISAPAVITGITNFCVGLTTSLSDATGGGVWSSSNTAIATVLPGVGHVTGNAPGTVVITYSIGTGCAATTSVIVNPLPSSISGNTNVCFGSVTTLSDATSGGTWSSSNTSVVIAGAGTGVITGLSTGTSVITYSLGAGCTVTASVSVNSLPSSVTGASTVCVGVTTTLSDATAGGAWSSGNTSVATIDPVAGIVYGITPGTANIIYISPAGCTANRNITVTSLPSAISGNTNVCPGSATILSDIVAGGTWTSINTLIASVGSGSGVVSGLSSGTANIIYSLSAGCFVTASVTVMTLPPAITGATNVCINSTTTLSDAAGVGVWSSANTAIAAIDPLLGIVTGVSSGGTTIAYTAGTGCTITTLFTVDPLPSLISGAANVCVGSGTTLSDAGGGTWSSNNTSIATIGLATGIFSGVSVGTATITYTLGTGCTITTTVAVIPLPLPVSGITNVCSGSATTLSDPASGGTWSSTNSAVATIGLSTGVVTGASTGTAAIFYKLGTGCTTTTTVTVNPLPSAISGINTVCVGSTTILSDAGAGTWSSSNSSVAAIGLTTGIVTGIAAGPATITYTLNTGCFAVIAVTVNPLPSSISGIAVVCAGSTTILSDALSGGTWSTGNTAIASVVAGSGIVSGITSGAATIVYSLGTGCLTTTTVTVNPLPSAISGNNAVCAGSVITLSDGGGGGWSSSNTTVATVGLSTGAVSGVSAGAVRITYTLSTGCMASASVTVNPLPSTITGVTGVCAGTTTILSDAATPGTWSCSNTSVATISPTGGIVSGLLPGSATITYTNSTGCIATNTVTVYSLPSAITGIASVCAGSATTLSDGGGGVWASSNTAVATIDPSSGAVSGISAGTSRIAYTLGSGCVAVTTVTVNALPSAIAGITNVCVGSAINLSDAGGGTWSSSNTGIATVGITTGMLSGVSPGTATITYKLATGCATTTTITVNPIPSSISGVTTLCATSSTILSDGVSGGTWSCSNTGIATVGLTNGHVSGVAPGSVNITYTLSAGCLVTASVIVETVPASIIGSSHICLGATTALSDAPTGGIWSSGSTAVATVDPGTGIVTGVTPGSAVISYSLGTGCMVSFTETVSPVLPVTGTTVVCAGETTNLSDVLSGGTWSSNNTSIATVSSAGIVTGVAGGGATIIYTLPTGCTEAALVTVNPLSPIGGSNQVCVGFTTLLNDAVPGGTWTSSNTSVATISSSGHVSGIAVGTTIINYALATGCTATMTVTVTSIPAPITGNTTVCVGATTYLSDISGSGTWSNSSSSGILIINGITGAMTGLSAGVETVTFTSSGGCTATTTVTVQSPPAGLSGPADICSGLTTTYTDATSGGIWSSGNTAVATITPSTGFLTAVSAGVSSVTYSIGAGCITIAAVTVDPTPVPISGATNVCSGGATTMVSDATPGGSWTSAFVTISSSGLVTGYTAGIATITYTLPTGCSTTTVMLVDSLPSAITGNTGICLGVPSSLSDAMTGGIWSSGDLSVATIGPFNGVITGLSTGTVPITYTNSAGCFVTALVTVHALPSLVEGNTTVCVASTTILSDASGGGTWSCGTTTIATTGAATGIVTGISAGIATVTYTVATGCMITASVTVNPLPVGITGVNHVCLGDPTTLSDYPLGGVWSSANTSIAVIDAFSGVVTGLSVNVTTITYTLLSTGCTRTTPLTVNPLPPAITGATVVCAGSAITLSDASAGGTWSSGNTSVATVGLGSGVVTGASVSTTFITYTLATGCTATTTITVEPLPTVYNVTGGGTFCVLDSGVHIGLNSSAVGFNYELYLGATLLSTLHGTGSPLDFGLHTTAGTYIIVAVNTTTGCSVDMLGNAVIAITPAVTPAVTITIDTGYTVCAGTMATFLATPVNGGTAPSYQWKVNGVNTATTNPYYYAPTNGDVVTCVLATSMPCVTALTATSSVTVTVTAYQAPAVSIISAPGDTVCAGTAVTFIPTPVFGGATPVYTWMRNGVNVSTGPSYHYIPSNGDSLYCIMASNYPCLTAYSAWSNDISMSVTPLMSPSVTISAIPGTVIATGQSDTLTAIVVNAGTSPLYQWYINGIVVPGATSAIYINSNFSNGDSVSCLVTGNGICSSLADASVIIIVNNVGVTQITTTGGELQLVPNPNKGEFTVKGSLSSTGGTQEVSLEVTDMLGQVVYQDKITVQNGKVNDHIILSNTLANGMYILNLRAATENRIFHFVVEQ